jgi:hypothetical protein
MRYLVTTEALMSGIRATTSTGPGLDRPSMTSWTPEHQPAWTPALDADYRVLPTRTGSPRDIRLIDLYVSHDGRLASPDGARTIDLSDFQAFALIRCGYP